MAAVDRLTTLQSSRSSGLPALRLALLLAAALSVSMAYGVTLPLLPELLERLAPGSAPADVARHTGWLTGAYTAALFVFSPAWGALSDRIDRRAVIAAGLVGSGLALLMLDRVSSLAGLYAARLAAGALSAAVLPAVFAYVVEVSEPSARRKQFAWVATGTALGFLLGPLAGIALSGMAGTGNSAMWIAGWMPDSPLVIVAAIGLLSAVATLGMPRSTPAATSDRIAATSDGEARIRTTLLMTALVVFGITIAEVGLTLLGRGSLSLGALGVAAYFALCSVVMVAVQLWGYPPLERLLGEARLVAAAFIGMAVGLALLAWPVAVWAPAIAFVLAGSGVGILIPALAVRISAAAGARPGWALGRQAAAANLGQALGAAATGVLYAAAAQAPFLVGAVVLGAGALLATRSDPERPGCGHRTDPRRARRTILNKEKNPMSTITAAIALSVDPVCGMQVDAASAAARLTHAGQDYLFCSSQCLEKFRADPKRYALARPGLAPLATMPAVAHGMPLQTALRQGQQGQAKDPICGMLVDKATALKTERGGRSYYFCSAGCQRTFESPEQELKSMKTRVAIALTGVLALAIMRAGAFIGLATGATILSWAPIDALPWFTWGMWLFLLVTPVQFIGGWSFYVGSWNALRNRSINMDLLIALGTSVAYFYSVAVIFFPEVLPVEVDERAVYFEVSAVIIAFVLLGKYMEEIIKKHSSAAVRKLLDLKPATAQVVRDGVEMEVPADSVMVGETVVVRPGQRIATDGVVEDRKFKRTFFS